MKKKFKKRKIELNVPYELILPYNSSGKPIKVKIVLLDGEKRVVFENGSESISLYDITGELKRI